VGERGEEGEREGESERVLLGAEDCTACRTALPTAVLAVYSAIIAVYTEHSITNMHPGVLYWFRQRSHGTPARH